MSGGGQRSIATRTGDDGTSTLLYGQRVPKDHPQIEAVGALDELNVAIGMVRATGGPGVDAAALIAIQRDLIALMGEVSCAEIDITRYAASNFAKLGDAELARLDAGVADLESRDSKRDGWATPGANLPSATLEVARTVARKAERRLVKLSSAGRQLRPLLLQYVNRLSDLLWLMARAAETP